MTTTTSMVIFFLAVVNMVAIASLLYKNKTQWAISLGIVEILLVYLSQMTS